MRGRHSLQLTLLFGMIAAFTACWPPEGGGGSHPRGLAGPDLLMPDQLMPDVPMPPPCGVDNPICKQGEVCCDHQCVAGACCSNSQCPVDQLCTNHMCAPCSNHAMCGNGAVCCPGANNVNSCVMGACCSSRDCPNSQTCLQNGCYESCNPNKCSAPNARCCGGACLPDTNCCTNADCAGAQACIGTKMNGQTSLHCGPCTDDLQCDPGMICQNGACVAGCHNPQRPCGKGSVCCNATCVPGACCANADCGLHEVCGADHQCVKTCNAESECDPGKTGLHCCGGLCLKATCVATAAGTGLRGSPDAALQNARFGAIYGIAVDNKNSDHVYFTDEFGLRVLDRNKGTVTRVAGQRYGCKAGPAGDSEMSYPLGLAIDSMGNVYVADEYCHQIWKYDPIKNEVSSLAGSINGGETDGKGASARFSYPTGLTIYNDTLFVTDYWGYTVRRVTLDGTVTTVAGVGGMAGQPFTNPSAIAADGTGNLYVGENANAARVYQIVNANTQKPVVVNVIFQNNQVVNPAIYPGNMAVAPGGRILAGIGGDGRIHELDPPQGPGLYTWNNNFQSPGVTLSAGLVPGGGSIWVGGYTLSGLPSVNTLSQRDVNTGAILQDMKGNPISFGVPGDPGVQDGPMANAILNMNSTGGISLDADGNAWIPDSVANRVRKIDLHSGQVTSYGSGLWGRQGGPASKAQFQRPVAVAAVAHKIYVADSYGTLWVIDDAASPPTVSQLQVIQLAVPNEQQLPGDVWMPNSNHGSMVADRAGNLYLPFITRYSASLNKYFSQSIVVKIPGWGTGKPALFAGKLDYSQQADCKNDPKATLFNPLQLAFDDNDNLYVADYLCGVRSIGPNGVPGPPSWSNFGVYGLAFGPSVNGKQAMYASAINGSWLAGVIYTVDKATLQLKWLVGSSNTTDLHYADGAAADAHFYGESSLAVEPDGNILYTDGRNNRLRRIFVK